MKVEVNYWTLMWIDIVDFLFRPSNNTYYHLSDTMSEVAERFHRRNRLINRIFRKIQKIVRIMTKNAKM